MLKLRRGVVVATDPLAVEVEGERRPAWADTALVGEVAIGDEVVVNVEALDLGLGSGGFDLVHANLTRGLAGGGGGGAHVMKLNYTPLQHPVEPVEAAGPAGEVGAGGEAGEAGGEVGAAGRRRAPVLVCLLHGQLAPAAWAAARARPGLRLGYVQTPGGALPGALSRTVAELRARGLLAGHVTAGPCYGGEHEAISVIGALHAAAGRLGWQAIVAGPGPGIIGSETAYGHGGMAALDTAHAALALGLPALLAPRVSTADPRPRHRGVSHHTRAVLDLLLAPVLVAAPAGGDGDGGEGGLLPELRAAVDEPHRLVLGEADLDGYAASGLPAEVMGRGIAEDPAFFATALAAGAALASLAGGAGEGG